MSVPKHDTGYAWVILAGCWILYFLLFGLLRSSGVLFVALIHHFGTTREEASWPFSLCSAVYLLAGPLASLMTYGSSVRKVTIFGSVISSLGLVLCFCVESLFWISILYGLIHGVGLGLVSTNIPVILGQYFSRHRTTAYGIAFTGSSISSFIFPRFIEYLLDVYGLNGTLLILGGVLMNSIVASSLFRRPSWEATSANYWEPVSNTHTKMFEKYDSVKTSLNDRRYRKSVNNNDDGVTDPLTTKIRQHDTEENFEAVNHWKSVTESCHVQSSTESGKDGEFRELQIVPQAEGPHRCSTTTNEERHQHITQEHILYENGTTALIPSNRKSIVVHDTNVHVFNVKKGNPLQNILESVREILHKKIFYALAYSSAVLLLSNITFFMVIVDYAIDSSVLESEAIYILPVYSLGDIFGRSGLGWLIDSRYVQPKNLMIITTLLTGALYQVYPLMGSFTAFSLIAVFHGLSSGSTHTLSYLLLPHYHGTNRLVLVVGMVSFVDGVMSFLRPPVVGLFRDVIGSYEWMFRTLGFASLITGALWLAEPWLLTEDFVTETKEPYPQKRQKKESPTACTSGANSA